MVDLVELHVNVRVQRRMQLVSHSICLLQADNHLAKTLYESCGFTEIDFIEDLYSEPSPPYGTSAFQMVNYNTDYMRRKTGGNWTPFELRDKCFREKPF